MANKIVLKKSSVASKSPLPADLDYGEVALNYADGKLYYKTASNIISSFSAGASSSAKKQEFTATAAQTTFTITNGYAVGSVQVFANGIALAAEDYTATNGTTVILTEARVAGDNIIVTSGGAFQASGGGGTTTNPLTVSTGLVLNSGTTFDGSAARTISLATSGASAGTYGNTYSSGSYIYMPQFTVDAYGRITSVTTNYVGLGGGGSNSFGNIYVNGSPAASASSSGDIINFVGTGATTVSYSGSGSYKTITISSTAGAGGGSTGWYSMISTSANGTILPKPTDYTSDSMTNMAYPKLFVGGEDPNNTFGTTPITGFWSSNSGSGTFNTYTNNDSNYTSSTIDIPTSSGGVRFAIAPKYYSPLNGTVSYFGSNYNSSQFNSFFGWNGPPGYSTNKSWFGILVVDNSSAVSLNATAVNCTIHETKSSTTKTYYAISMTDAQCTTVAQDFANVLTFSISVTMRAYFYYAYQS